jgi:hypothetical protein
LGTGWIKTPEQPSDETQTTPGIRKIERNKMKVRATTDLTRYGFKKDQYGFWVLQIPEFTGKGKDKETPIRFELIVDQDRNLYFYTTNDHVALPRFWEQTDTQQVEDEYHDAFSFEETISIPKVIIDMIRNREIEEDNRTA